MFSLKIITDLEQFQYQVENFEKTVTKLIQAKKKMSTKPTSAQPINSQLQQTPIAIVGMASIFPQAENVQQYWENIYREVDCITSVPASHWDVDAYYDPDPMAIDKTYCTRGGFIPEIDFNPMEFGLPPNFLEVTDVSQLLSLVVAKQAMADAGYGESSPFNRDRTGITLGVAVGRPLATPLTCRLQYPIWERVLKNSGISAAETDKIIENLKLAYVGWQENAFPGLLGNVVAGRIANRLDLGGTNCTVDAACASSLAAFKMAVSELIEDRCNLMITGGVDTDNSIFTYLCFSKTPALSRKQQSKPFDEDADGILLGEGIGMVVLKRLADAERDGDRIYAVIKGIGSSSDGRFKSIYAPRQEGQVNALQRAYQDAGVEPASIGLIEAHGTGTFAGDPAEFEALKQVFSSGQVGRQSIALGSVKSQIGHTKAAAGAASLIKAALALHQKILPPTINITQPNPKLDLENSPFYLNTKPRPWIQPHGSDPRRAGVSAFGFGGTNFHVVLEEYGGNPETNSLGSPRPQRLHKTPESMVLFASTPDRLFLECETTLLQLQSETGEQRYIEWVDASRSLDMPLSAARVGFLADSLAEACQKLKTAVAWMRKQPNLSAWDHPQGIYYRAAGLDLQGKVVALFSGQGSQYPDMGRELAINFPEIQDAYSQIDSLFSQEGLQPPSTIVFPPPVFTDEHRQTQVEALRNTEYAQSAIGAFSVGLFKIMEQAGFQPDFVAGHSFGELTALWAAKVLSDKDYFALVKARGQAMAASPAPDADAGAMLAVKAEVSVVEAAITGVPEVAIANLNSPQQVVLAGTRSAIISLQAKMQSQGILATLLPVAAAFHTPLVAHAQKPFAQAVAATSFQSPQIPVYTNITGQPYPNEPRAIQKLLKEHLLNRVLFKQEIETISAKGGYCFVEFGPKAVLTNLVKEILGDVPHIAIALNASSKEDSDRQFREAVLQLRIAGLALKNIDPYALAPSAPVVKRSKANVRLCGANYLSENTQRAFDKALGNSDPATLSEAQVAPQTAASKMLTMTALTLNGSTSIETLEPLVADHPPPTFSPNGVSAHRSALALNQPTPEMESQIMPDLALNYQHFLTDLNTVSSNLTSTKAKPCKSTLSISIIRWSMPKSFCI
ncbi:MAG: acyltransferase domain-containing protein [Acaryochloris sp. CRU_2_0]|nr:acyltransferase domain-containing protein [Acaryochloris sp. CRU_2_0]